MTNFKKISILLVNYHTEEYILDFLKDFIKQTMISNDYEIIIVNNCQTKRMQEALKESQLADILHIKIIESAVNLGFGRAMNLAAKTAKGEHFLVGNPDLRMMQNDYLEKLYQKTHIHSNYGIISTQLINDKKQDKSEFYEYDLGLKFKNDEDRIKWFRGALLLIRREVFQKINGFDSDFFMYCEDEDICIRVKKNDLKLVKINELKIYHKGGVSEGVRNINFYIMWYKSMVLLNFKHLSEKDFYKKMVSLRNILTCTPLWHHPKLEFSGFNPL